MMSGLAFCLPSSAVVSDNAENPYQSIVDRNVFNLKPAPAPADPSETTKPTALKITLTGMISIGTKRVLMKTAPPQGKPGEGPKTEQSYILAEGQREGDIEVIEINEKQGSVKVNNAGSVQTLTFEKDGAKLPATQAPAAPGAPNGAAPIPGLPVARPAAAPAAAPGNPASFQLPTRVPRVPTPGAQASSANLGVGGVGSTTAPGLYLPGNTTTPVQASTGSSQIPSTPAPQYSLEEQAIMIEANRHAGGPGASLLPPTALTPQNGPTTPGNSGQSSTGPMMPLPGRPIQPGPY
jgi:hypothetical protein